MCFSPHSGEPRSRRPAPSTTVDRAPTMPRGYHTCRMCQLDRHCTYKPFSSCISSKKCFCYLLTLNGSRDFFTKWYYHIWTYSISELKSKCKINCSNKILVFCFLLLFISRYILELLCKSLQIQPNKTCVSLRKTVCIF